MGYAVLSAVMLMLILVLGTRSLFGQKILRTVYFKKVNFALSIIPQFSWEKEVAVSFGGGRKDYGN